MCRTQGGPRHRAGGPLFFSVFGCDEGWGCTQILTQIFCFLARIFGAVRISIQKLYRWNRSIHPLAAHMKKSPASIGMQGIHRTKKRPADWQDAFGGGGWIRTTEANATDLQSAPFGHSGTPPYKLVRSEWKKWSWWTDSNPRPVDYKSTALPTELHQQISSSTTSISLSSKKNFVNTYFRFYLLF